MNSLDDVLRGEATERVDEPNGAADPNEAEHTGEAQQETQPAAEGEAAEQQPAGEDAPPASEPNKQVPLKALEEERKNRQDWKEKAIRFEEELKHLRAQQSQAQTQQQPSQQQMEMTPEMLVLNERMNNSEDRVREKYGSEDVDAKLAVFERAVQENPALRQELMNQRHPWQWMYSHAQKLQALADIGDDPTAYEQKLRAKWEAEMKESQQQQEPTQQSQTQPAAALPRSLANNRSAAPRSAPVWSGPTSLNDVIRR